MFKKTVKFRIIKGGDVYISQVLKTLGWEDIHYWDHLNEWTSYMTLDRKSDVMNFEKALEALKDYVRAVYPEETVVVSFNSPEQVLKYEIPNN
jgi:hypothetical protein